MNKWLNVIDINRMWYLTWSHLRLSDWLQSVWWRKLFSERMQVGLTYNTCELCIYPYNVEGKVFVMPKAWYRLLLWKYHQSIVWWMIATLVWRIDDYIEWLSLESIKVCYQDYCMRSNWVQTCHNCLSTKREIEGLKGNLM